MDSSANPLRDVQTVSLPGMMSLPLPPIPAGSRCVGLIVLLLIAVGTGRTPQPAQAQTDGSLDADSLSVTTVVERVLETHPAIDAAKSSLAAAIARVDQARSAYWPRVQAVASYRRQDPVPEISVPGAPTPGASSGNVGIQPNNLYDGHVEATQSLYTFGRTKARVEQARAGRTTARRRIDLERSDLAFQAVRAYYTALLASARVRVQREQIAQLERTLEVVERREAAGTATAFEIQSTQTRLSAARSTLTRFRSLRRQQNAELRRLLGVRSDVSLGLDGTLRDSHTAGSRASADTLLDHAVLRHPSVRVARAQVQRARRAVTSADRSDAPQLALTARGGVKNGYPGDLNEPRLNESIGLSLQVPLFEGFATQRRIEEAEAERAAAEARLADVRRQVQTRVEQAAADLRAHLDQLETTALRVKQAKRAAELARTRYKAGTVTNLDLLRAQTELQRARLEQTETHYRVIMGRYTLRRAAGTLLPFDAPQ